MQTESQAPTTTKLSIISRRRHRLLFEKRNYPDQWKPVRFIQLCIVLTLLAGSLSATAAPLSISHPQGIIVRGTPHPVSNGRTVLLEIDARNITDTIVGIQAWHGERAIPVYQHPLKGSGVYIGFIGLSYYLQPTVVPVKLEWTNQNGYYFLQIPIEVTKGQFKKERLRVPKNKVSPSKKDRRRIDDERVKIKKVYRTPHQSRLWSAAFSMPATGAITSPFGTERVLNGTRKSYHSGVDFRAPTGTPIYAANDGIVRFTGKLFYSGNHLIIDHGLGIFTNYSHLSEFTTEPGKRVRQGQQIGLSGATGRSNGPHLHWGAKVNGVSVDPLQLKELIESLFTVPEVDTAKW